MLRNKFKDCKMTTQQRCDGKWFCFIKAPHNPIVSTFSLEENEEKAIITCTKKWKSCYGKTNRKKIFLHIPHKQTKKER